VVHAKRLGEKGGGGACHQVDKLKTHQVFGQGVGAMHGKRRPAARGAHRFNELCSDQSAQARSKGQSCTYNNKRITVKISTLMRTNGAKTIIRVNRKGVGFCVN